MVGLFLQHNHLLADNDELGTPITISAFAGFSCANRLPDALRTA